MKVVEDEIKLKLDFCMRYQYYLIKKNTKVAMWDDKKCDVKKGEMKCYLKMWK